MSRVATALQQDVEGIHSERTIPEVLIRRREARARLSYKGLVASRFTILVMEEDDAQRRAMTELLRNVGFRVVAAASAKEGLGLLVRRYVDLVVCGMKLAECEGCDVIRALKNLRCLPSHQSIPIILVAPLEQETTSAALRSGADLVCLQDRVASMLVPQVLFLVQ